MTRYHDPAGDALQRAVDETDARMRARLHGDFDLLDAAMALAADPAARLLLDAQRRVLARSIVDGAA